MSRYDLVENLQRCATQLERHLNELQQLLATLPLLDARVYNLPAIKKGTEHQPINQISVTQYLGDDARTLTIEHYCRLFIHHQSENISTKAAIRLPGALCFAPGNQQTATFRQIVSAINIQKARLEQIITVESGLKSEARFDFVHTHLRGLLTLNAYRAITLLEAPDTVRFGWANKSIIKNITKEEILTQLDKSLTAGRARAPWSKEQWAEKITQEKAALLSLPNSAKLKIKRPVKVQPIARIWYKKIQQQQQLACPSPLLILCADPGQLPQLGKLLDYDAEHITHRYKPNAERLFPVIPRLHLFSDRL